MTYTLRLIALQCTQRQEAGGDEIYLQCNGETIFSWKAIGRPFSNVMNDKRTTQFDFQSCQYPTPAGPQTITAHTPDEFVFEDQTEPLAFELWESDEGNWLRGDDDKLGRLHIDESDIKMGEQAFPFMLGGAQYELRYAVRED